MPGTIFLGTQAQGSPVRRPDRWLNFRFAWPPESNIRDREDSPGARNPYNLWTGGSIVGDEGTGAYPMQIVVFDDDIRLGGTKAFSYSIQGQCVDSLGSPASGATVELYRLPNWDAGNGPLLVASVIADANGLYGFAVPDNVTQYFVIAYVTGKGGVSARNLVGA
jgi:hypothetical protein